MAVPLTIPLSIALAGLLLRPLGVGLNTMTLGGLAIAVGLLVDAAIIMIDLGWCGGISEARKIANMAEASELPVTLHDCTGPVVFAASCALSATLPNVNYQEAVRAYVTGWYRELADNVPAIANGAVTPLDGPGLGLKLRPEVFERTDATIRVTRG